MGHPDSWINNISDLELSFYNYFPNNNYIIHNACLDPPEFLKEFEFDVIILNSSFLGMIFHKSTYERIIENYSFIKNLSSFKIALPQDDYYCNDELNELLNEFRINLTLSPFYHFKDTLHKKYLQNGGEILPCYTGYITPDLISLTSKIKSLKNRKFDVIYKASGSPTFPNNMAQLKADLGKIFLNDFQNYRMRVDVDSKKFYFNEDWINYLMNGRIVLGSNSGSSEIISNLSIVEKLNAYKLDHGCNNEEVIKVLLEEKNKNLRMTCLSPRNFEAALTMTAQLLVPGEYGDILEPYEDFFPYNNDKNSILEFINDKKLQKKIAKNCKEKILSIKELRIDYFLKTILDKINKTENINSKKFETLKEKYNNKMETLYIEYFTNFSFYKIDKFFCDLHSNNFPLKTNKSSKLVSRIIGYLNNYEKRLWEFINEKVYPFLKQRISKKIQKNTNYFIK